MIYIPLAILEEINECKHEIGELDKVLNQVTKPDLRKYLCEQRTWFVNRLNDLNLKMV